MEKRLMLLALLFTSLVCFSQTDKIIGVWLAENGRSQIQVYKTSDGKYAGKVVWITPEKKDKRDEKNPNEKLRSRRIVGITVVWGLTYNPKTKAWENGTIYEPKSGNTYECQAWFENGNYDALNLKGFIRGMNAVGKTTVWRRDILKR